jgi:hypothetical protein
VKKIFQLAKSVYWGSFSSFNRNALFWVLALAGEHRNAAALVIGFASVTIIKTTLETPAHSMLASSTEAGDWSLRSSYLSSFVVSVLGALYVLVSGFPWTAACIVILAMVAESLTSLVYSQLTHSGRLTQGGHRLFIFDALGYGICFLVLAGLTIVDRDRVVPYCVAFSVLVLALRAIVYGLACGWTGINLRLRDIGEYMRQCARYRGYFLSSLALAINSNLYKYLVGGEGASVLVEVYKIMSVFIVADVLSSGIKNNLLSRDKAIFMKGGYLRSALQVSLMTVLVCTFGLFGLGYLGVVDLRLLPAMGLMLIALSKVFDSMKGYVKTHMYVTRTDGLFLRASIFTILVSTMLACLYRFKYIDFSELIFGISASSLAILYGAGAVASRPSAENNEK